MVGEDGIARLGNFGIKSILGDPTGEAKKDESAEFRDNLDRYAAPELLNPWAFGKLKATPTKASDVYSFGATAFTVRSSCTSRGHR